MPINTETIVDISQRATQLATELGSLESFLVAAQTLLSAIDNLPAVDIERDGRKIVALTEVARSTLKASGVKLYSFASCPSSRVPFKQAYFDLLRALSARRDVMYTDSGIKGRLDKLLLPLSEGFVIERRIVPTKRRLSPLDPPYSSHALTLPPRHASKAKCAASPAGTTTRCTPTATLMPPPDAFPPSGRSRGESSCRRKIEGALQRSPKARLRMFEPADEDERDHGSASESDDDDEGGRKDDAPTFESNVRLRPHRFGIFCTPKRSMLQQRELYPLRERSGRSRTVRPVRTE